MTQKILTFLLRPDWCVDNGGDATLRLWGWFGLTFYKWNDGAIFQNARGFQRVAKRGISARVDGGQP